MNTITLSRNGATRTIPTGFSWTTLFFGPVPSIIRWHWSFMIKIFACDVISIIIAAGLFGLDWLLAVWLAFRVAISSIRNDTLRHGLIQDGWSREPMQRGIELRGNVAVAANDEEEHDYE